MLVTPDKIGWSSYGSYEGPFFHGVVGFRLPAVPDEADRYLAVITAAEGGHYDAINMYDRGVISVGVIQWIEAGQYTVSGMLGHVIEKCGAEAVMVPLKPALAACGATFKKNAKGQWRFFFNDAKGEVDSLEKTRILFLGCQGLKGTWTPEAKARARLWAACMANVWASEATCRAQNSYTRARLSWFITTDAKKHLFDHEPDTGWVGAVRAAYVSFAVNMPAVANAQLKAAVAELQSPKWSPDWCTGVLKKLVHGSGIGIWPVRYNGIRPVLEKLWGVSLPKTAKDLASWQEPVPPAVPEPEMSDTPAPPVPETSDPAPEPPTVPPEPELKVELQVGPMTSLGPIPEPDARVQIIPVPKPGPTGVLGFILWLLQTIFSAFTRKKM